MSEPAYSEPAVPASAYTREYYSTACGGYEDWISSGGAQGAGAYAGYLQMAALGEGEVVVDVGSGRGELLAVAVELGASRAIGLEYSPDAIAMSQTTLEHRDTDGRGQVLLADARRMPIADATADLVTMLDVVEHLTPEELSHVLQEVRRVLRPGGRVFVHTLPNRSIYDQTYRWLRRLWPTGRRWPVDPRNDYERLMHVNEQTVGSLTDALVTAGFAEVDVTLGQWVYVDFVPSALAKRIFHVLARSNRTKHLAVANIFGRASSPMDA